MPFRQSSKAASLFLALMVFCGCSHSSHQADHRAGTTRNIGSAAPPTSGPQQSIETTTAGPTGTSTTVPVRAPEAPGEAPTTSATTQPPNGPEPATTAAGGSTFALHTGFYSDSTQPVPHYEINLTQATSSSLVGSVQLVAQDGRLSQVFGFSATPSAATFPLQTSPTTAGVTAQIVGATIVLGGCQSYLKYTRSASDCVFAPTS